MAKERARDHERWVRLKLRLAAGALYLDESDERGPVKADDEPWLAQSTQPGAADALSATRRFLCSLFPTLHVRQGLGERLRSGFADLNATRENHAPPAPGAAPLTEHLLWRLAVFVEPPALPLVTATLAWEAWIEATLLGPGSAMPWGPDMAQRCVFLRWQPMQALPPLERFPVKVSCLGAASQPWLDGLRERNWVLDETVRQHGLALPDRDGPGFGREAPIVIRQLGLRRPPGTALSPSAPANVQERPRLVVNIVGAEGSPTALLNELVGPWQLERWASQLIVVLPATAAPNARAMATAAVMQLMYAWVHDFALHDFVAILRQRLAGATVWLASDPSGLQSLRLSGAMRALIDRGHAGTDAAARWGRIGNPRLMDVLSSLQFDFTREHRGLRGMASAVERLAQAPPDADTSPGVHVPERRTDVAVERFDEFGVLETLDAQQRREPLWRGWRYRVRVHIGQRDPRGSAVEGDVPTIDSLLPPPQDETPRRLEVAVYAKRFELLSPGLQTLLLPRQGPTAPVYFELRAPQELGPADLRIVLYWNNNLLQSFVLEGEVAERAHGTGQANEPLRVRLAAAGMDHFEEIEAIRRRDISIALNDDLGSGTHTVMLKGGEGAQGWRSELSLTSEEMNATMEDFRSVLAAGFENDFKGALRHFARIGRAIWGALSLSGAHIGGDALHRLRERSDCTVQFVRHGSGRPFPWQLVYDYELPSGPAFEAATVCLADGVRCGDWQPGDMGCPHHLGAPVVCIEGFWSVRLRSELLSEDIGAAKGSDTLGSRCNRARAHGEGKLVTMGLGVNTQPGLDLKEALGKRYGGGFHAIDPHDHPVAAHLWAKRPAVLIVMSHLLPADRKQNLMRRIYADLPNQAGARISASELSNERARGAWRDEQPLVLLLACDSNRQDLGELTNLVDTFLKCGAAAVMGTEWEVSASRCAQQAQSLLEAMLDKAPRLDLGAATQRRMREALRQKDAAAFVFTTYGSADLTIIGS